PRGHRCQRIRRHRWGARGKAAALAGSGCAQPSTRRDPGPHGLDPVTFTPQTATPMSRRLPAPGAIQFVCPQTNHPPRPPPEPMGPFSKPPAPAPGYCRVYVMIVSTSNALQMPAVAGYVSTRLPPLSTALAGPSVIRSPAVQAPSLALKVHMAGAQLVIPAEP